MRLHAFDNLRMCSIVIVILFHALCGYTQHAAWWYVHIADEVPRFTVFMGITDNFVMATMFFVSGFFAARAFRHKGDVGSFISSKAKRLLIPGYLHLLFIAPLLFFISQSSPLSALSMVESFTSTWNALATFEFKPVEPGSQSFHHHLWFVEALFMISIVFLLLRPVLKTFLFTEDTSYGKIILKLSLLMAVAQSITFLMLQSGFDMMGWHSLGGLSVLQPARQGAYIGAFAAGIYFFGLYGKVTLKKLSISSVLAIVIYFVMFQCAAVLMSGVMEKDSFTHMQMANNWVAMCFFFMLTTVLVFLKFFSREYRLLKPFYPLNYGIYLMHMVFVVLLQKLLNGVELPISWRITLITIGAFLLSAAFTYAKQAVERTMKKSNTMVPAGA